MESFCSTSRSGKSRASGDLVYKVNGKPQLLFAHALTEPKGASDRWLGYNALEAAMDTKAKKVDGGWVINGRKHYISNGYDASLYIIYANTNPSVGMMDGIVFFYCSERY